MVRLLTQQGQLFRWNDEMAYLVEGKDGYERKDDVKLTGTCHLCYYRPSVGW